MCFISAIVKAAAHPIEKAINKDKLNSLRLKEELLAKQRNAVADRNAQTTETIKDSKSNNVKRNISSLRIPLLKTWGTGSNLGEDIGYYGLNLGENK